jgi:hypothetical protein
MWERHLASIFWTRAYPLHSSAHVGTTLRTFGALGVPLNMASGRRDPKPQSVLHIAVGVSCDGQREIRSFDALQPATLNS